MGHFIGQGPPQSRSVSPPFCAPSLHVAAHVLATGSQRPPTQSESAAHAAPNAHFLGQPPPQSTLVSGPFFTPSLHDGAAHTLTPPISTQTPLKQSLPLRQNPPAGQ